MKTLTPRLSGLSNGFLLGLLGLLLVGMAPSIGEARLVFDSADPAFSGATIVSPGTQGAGAGVQSFRISSNGIDFDFVTTSPMGTGGFGSFLTSFFPEGIEVTLSSPAEAIGFDYLGGECAGTIEFRGAVATQSVAFAQGDPQVFIGAADIGDISSVFLNGQCFAASWGDMRFIPSTGGPPPTDDADLGLSKTGMPGGISQADGPQTYTLDVSNFGPDAATNVQVIDFTPFGLNLVSADPPDVSTAPNLEIQQLADLPPGASAQATLVYDLPPFPEFGCNSTIVNRARVTTSSIDANPANDLSIFANRFDRAARSGFAEICSNRIDDDCDGFADCLDSSCSHTAACQPPLSGDDPRRNPPLPCEIDPSLPCLGPDGPIIAPPGPGEQPPPPRSGPASCQGSNIHGDLVDLPSCCCTVDACGAQNIAQCGAAEDPNFKTANPPVNAFGYGFTAAGQIHRYSITYENIGNADAHDVEVIDVLHPDLDDASLVIQDGGVYDPVRRVIVWIDPVVPPGVARTVSFEVAMRGDAPPLTRVRNQATVIFPDAAPPTRIDTNFVEHVIPFPEFPIEADLGVYGCRETASGSGEWIVRIFNRGAGYARNVSAEILDPPPPVSVVDGFARFAHEDLDPEVEATTLALGTTESFDHVHFQTVTAGDPCRALRWRIRWTDEGDDVVQERVVQVSPDVDRDAVPDEIDNCAADSNPDQMDTDGDGIGDVCDLPDPPSCTPAPDPDLNDDTFVNILDFSIVGSCFGSHPTGPPCGIADTDCSGAVDMVDVNFILRSFGQSGL